MDNDGWRPVCVPRDVRCPMFLPQPHGHGSYAARIRGPGAAGWSLPGSWSTRTSRGCSRSPAARLMEGCGALRPLSSAQSRNQVHPILASDHRIRPGRTARAACAESEPERLCRALGQVGEGGVPVKDCSVRRVLAAAEIIATASLLWATNSVCRRTQVPCSPLVEHRMNARCGEAACRSGLVRVIVRRNSRSSRSSGRPGGCGSRLSRRLAGRQLGGRAR